MLNESRLAPRRTDLLTGMGIALNPEHTGIKGLGALRGTQALPWVVGLSSTLIKVVV